MLLGWQRPSSELLQGICRELLAIKLALEWRHWLEGSEISYMVWTDDKNLEYIRKH